MGLISRQAAINAAHKSILDFFDICDDDEKSPMTYKDERLLEFNKAITTQIKAVPSADAVEVVRCKDCKYYAPIENDYGICEDISGLGRWWKPDDYCSYGERKDD